MLTPMQGARTLVAEARRAAGLSIRELARLADLSFTTISRIESGESDPTLDTLRRILEAAGCTLRLTVEPGPRPRRALADLASAVSRTPAGERPNWTRLRGFLDYLAMHPDEIPQAIIPRPHTSSRLMDALLAGIAEKLADDRGLPRPGWTRTAPKIKPEWAMPGTARMREERRQRAPRQLLDRGLVIDERSLWRDQETVGV